MKLIKPFNFHIKRKITNLVFIFGCPRSGTTWLWSILESHNDTIPFVSNTKTFDGKYETSESGIYIKNQKKAKKLISEFALTNRDCLVFEKTPSHTLHYQKIFRDFPNTRAIVIFRNPLAIVNSMLNSKMKAFENYDINKSISEVKKYYKSLIEISKKENTITVTYEKLFKDKHHTIFQILKQLNLKTNSIEEIISENTKNTKVSVNGAFRSGLPDSYKNELGATQIQIIREELVEEFIFFNNLN
jgi:hypothetical protein